MGDISEMRGLVTVISFLGVFILLIGLIPAQFLVAEYEGYEPKVLHQFEGIDIQSYKFLKNWTANHQDFDKFTLGGHTLDWGTSQVAWDTISFHHWTTWFIFPVAHSMDDIIHAKTGINRATPPYDVLYLSDMDLDYDNDGLNGLRYTVRCKHLQLDYYFSFNETLYDDPTNALQNDALWILSAMDFDQASTSYNAWNLVAMLLTFQIPQVHWIINALLSFGLWACIAYLAYILVLRAIGAIFGGGGA